MSREKSVLEGMKFLFFILIINVILSNGEAEARKGYRDVLPREFDFVVVGAGAAGLTVAARLSEDPDVTVCVLEAGIKDTESSLTAGIETPRLWPIIGLSPGEINWNHTTVAQRGLNNRDLFTGMGKVLGGSTSHNAMVYFRGFREDFDNWAATGAYGWSFQDVLPFFTKFENFQIPNLSHQSFKDDCNPVTITQNPNTINSQLYLLFERTAKELNLPITECDQESPFGLCIVQSTIKSGKRVSTSTAFLRPNKGRRNLHVITEALVGKILISRRNKRAYGVKVHKHGRVSYIWARREIIISAGSFESPKLLQLSGIGKRDILWKHRIRPVQILPVGENLHDHVLLPLDLLLDVDTPTPKTVTDPNVLAEYLFQRKGFYATSTRAFNIFFDLSKQRRNNRPEIQVLFIGSRTGGTITKENLREGTLPVIEDSDERNGTNFVVFLAQPKSRGQIRLRSRDPMDLPIIDPQYLTDREDVQNMIRGIREMQKLARTENMKAANAKLTLAGSIPDRCKFLRDDSDEQWECILRHLAEPAQHPVSSCKLGRTDDRSSVVDLQLRVIGIRGLRVADASVMPQVTSANIMSPTIMIGERAAYFIKETKFKEILN